TRTAYENIRRGRFQSMRGHAVGASNGINPGVLSCDYVHIRVSNQYSFGLLAVRFAKQLAHPKRIGFLGLETVAAVDLEKELIHAKRVDDRARRTYRFVAQHRH